MMPRKSHLGTRATRQDNDSPQETSHHLSALPLPPHGGEPFSTSQSDSPAWPRPPAEPNQPANPR